MDKEKRKKKSMQVFFQNCVLAFSCAFVNVQLGPWGQFNSYISFMLVMNYYKQQVSQNQNVTTLYTYINYQLLFMSIIVNKPIIIVYHNAISFLF